MKNLLSLFVLAAMSLMGHAQDLRLNDREYFECQGVNVLVFSNNFYGGFNVEKNSGIEIIHHGVRTVQGGAVRLNNTPEQWDLVPKTISRKVNREQGCIEVVTRYDDYDFDSKIIVTAKGKTVEIAVWLDKPVPAKLAGEAGFNIEFLPSQYWLKTYSVDGRLGRLPRYATSLTVTRPNSEKPRQFKGFKTYDDRGTDRFVDPLPIHMNHMYVNEGYRTWHGEPFKEGYLQAPESDHFDLHRQGPTTDTKYKPLELIPGLNVGGFFDAGDFDIETGSNINVVQNFIRTWELFKPQRDETFVSQQQRYVDLHSPDGVPDILQFIEHGTLNLVAQAEQIGHMASTLSNSVLDNYHHLGDAASITDGLHYDPTLKPYEVWADGKRSGTPDDMWAFTTRSPRLDLQAADVHTSAARVLKGYNDELAARAQSQADRLRKEANQLLEQQRARTNAPAMTNDAWLFGDASIVRNVQVAIDSIPMKDEAYHQRIRPLVEKFAAYIKSFDLQNPYGVPIGLGNWAGVNMVLNFGIAVNYAHIYFPDIVSKDEVYRVSNWLYGCHPYHNYSFVAVVGAARPKQVFYGNNRADFSFIPGNVAPGLLFRQPDHFENYDDWPFLWGQNEGTIAGNTQYIIFGSSFKNIVTQH